MKDKIITGILIGIVIGIFLMAYPIVRSGGNFKRKAEAVKAQLEAEVRKTTKELLTQSELCKRNIQRLAANDKLIYNAMLELKERIGKLENRRWYGK